MEIQAMESILGDDWTGASSLMPLSITEGPPNLSVTETFLLRHPHCLRSAGCCSGGWAQPLRLARQCNLLACANLSR